MRNSLPVVNKLHFHVKNSGLSSEFPPEFRKTLENKTEMKMLINSSDVDFICFHIFTQFEYQKK